MSPYNKSITYCIVTDVSERTATVASPAATGTKTQQSLDFLYQTASRM